METSLDEDEPERGRIKWRASNELYCFPISFTSFYFTASPLIWTHRVTTSFKHFELHHSAWNSIKLCRILEIVLNLETRRIILVRCNAVRRTDTTRGWLADCNSVSLVRRCLLLSHQTSLPLPLSFPLTFNCNVGPSICRTVPNAWAKFLLWIFPWEINLLYLLVLSELRSSSYTVHLKFK
jgi:hypothetical protein